MRPTRPGRTSGRTASTTRRRRTRTVTVKSQTGSNFVLAWTTDDPDNPPTRRRAPAPCPSRRRTSVSSTPTGRARRRRRASRCSARRSAVRQQPREHVLQRDLGRARAGARRAAAPRPELERDGRRAERRHEHERLRRHGVGHGSGVPDAGRRGEGARRRSRRPARSAIRTAAACARRGGCTASGR